MFPWKQTVNRMSGGFVRKGRKRMSPAIEVDEKQSFFSFYHLFAAVVAHKEFSAKSTRKMKFLWEQVKHVRCKLHIFMCTCNLTGMFNIWTIRLFAKKTSNVRFDRFFAQKRTAPKPGPLSGKGSFSTSTLTFVYLQVKNVNKGIVLASFSRGNVFTTSQFPYKLIAVIKNVHDRTISIIILVVR